MQRGIWIIVGLAILGLSGLAVHEASGQKKEEKKVDAQPGERVFELRTYWAYPGKMKELEARFKNHTCKLFEKHGITVVGFWRPIEQSQKLVEQRTKLEILEAEYKAAKVKLAEADYKATLKAINDWIEADKHKFTPHVPPPEPETTIIAQLRLEKRQQEAEGKKKALVAAMLDQGAGAEHEYKLVYLLAFPSREAAAKSWEAFRKDPDWIAAKTASEKDGTLVVKIESVYMKATDFSPMK